MLSRIGTLTARQVLKPIVICRTVATTAEGTTAGAGSACALKTDATSQPSALKIKEGPDRDLVNFPRKPRPLHPGKVRMGFIPVEWMDFFYSKTGVTGPYLWLTGFSTFVISKEYFVLEHEFYHGVGLGIFIYLAMKNLGPKLAAALDKDMDVEESTLEKARSEQHDSLKDAIVLEKTLQDQTQSQKLLFDAKRENIALQLEADYRQRLVQVYSEVKRRLDYQVELLSAARRIEQQHMVKWIVDNVIKSITPQQEKDAIQHCIGNLKSLAAKA